MGFVTETLMPALPILLKMEERGIPINTHTRDRFRRDTKRRLEAAEKDILAAAQPYHEKRLQRIRESQWLYRLEQKMYDRELRAGMCSEHKKRHPKYATRGKCQNCVWSQNLDGTVRDLGKISASYKAARELADSCKHKAEDLTPYFIPTNDWHWRFLLFDEVGLGLQVYYLDRAPVTDTMRKKGIKVGTPKVDDKAIERLRRSNPGVPILELRVEISETRTRLNSRLNMEPGEGWPKPGRVHAPYAMHRTWNQRLSCGDDDSDADKSVKGEGHMQNIPKRDRAMFRAEPGHILLQPDMSQFQARIQAWLARDDKMMNAWKAGMDIHEITAEAIYEERLKLKYPTLEERYKATRIEEVLVDGILKPMREMGKRRRHGTNCGMGYGKFADMTGISKPEALRIANLDRKAWPKEHEFQEKVLMDSHRDGFLVNAFGMKNRFHEFEKRKRYNGGEWWVPKDAESALSFHMASLEACMVIAMLPEVNYLAENFGYDAELLTSTHDSFLIHIANDQEAVLEFIKQLRPILEREWPQMGDWQGMALEKEGYTGNRFWCPVDFKLGFNWGDKHICKEKCAKEYKTEVSAHPSAPLKRDGEPCIDYNPDGLDDIDETKPNIVWPQEYWLDRPQEVAA